MTLNGRLRYTTPFVLAVFVLSGLVHHVFSSNIIYSIPISGQTLIWGTMGGTDAVYDVGNLKGGNDVSEKFPSSFDLASIGSEFSAGALSPS